MGEKQARRDVLDREMQSPTFWNDQEKAKGVIAELKTLNAVLKPFEDVIKQAGDLTASIELAEEDGGDDFDDEIRAACTRAVADLEAFELRSMLGGPNDHCNVFVTIHAGAGGTEACDWAEMLMRMYMMWAESKRFAVQITDREDGGAAGIAEATIHIKGDYAYGNLRGETGVHRLVRISPFDSAARRHTSFASVDVLPEVDETIDIVIRDDELKRDTFPFGRTRRPAPEQDRVGRPLHPPPNGHRRRITQRTLTAQERRQRLGPAQGQADPHGGRETRGRVRQEI